MSVRRCLLLSPLLLLAACLDFTDPILPNRATPAVLQVNMRAFDVGQFIVDGTLTPGRDSAGFQRVVQSPFMMAGGFVVEPKTLGERGLRTYSSSFAIPRGATGGPFELIPPDVRDAGALPPVSIVGLRRTDPDTIFVEPGSDVLLHMDTVPVQSMPSQLSRQWFLDVRSGARVFRISSDGPPPPTLRIPSDFIPPSPDGRAFIGMIYFQTASLRSDTNNYFANIVLDVRLNWVIVFRDST
jgi:hypothetical protein